MGTKYKCYRYDSGKINLQSFEAYLVENSVSSRRVVVGMLG